MHVVLILFLFELTFHSIEALCPRKISTITLSLHQLIFPALLVWLIAHFTSLTANITTFSQCLWLPFFQLQPY